MNKLVHTQDKTIYSKWTVRIVPSSHQMQAATAKVTNVVSHAIRVHLVQVLPTLAIVIQVKGSTGRPFTEIIKNTTLIKLL